MKEKISKILYDEFTSVYCNTCEDKGVEKQCDYCHRKYMNWSLSKEAADIIAEKIMKELGI